MKHKLGRPKGSKNQPSLIKFERRKALALSRECMAIVNGLADSSGLAPATVLEDLILAGSYSMGQAYDNLSNLRRRFREKSSTRNHVVPVTSTEEAGQNGSAGTIQGSETMALTPGNEYVPEGPGTVHPGSVDALEQRGHRPEDNPAFRNVGGVGGDVIGTTGAISKRTDFSEFPEVPSYSDEGAIPDPGPVPTDEEGNPLAPPEPEETY